MAIAFQLDTAATTGGFGVQPFGTSSFGGGAPAVLALPTVEVGSDDPLTKVRTKIGESLHVRQDLVIGARVWAERGVWHFVWKDVDAAFVLSLKVYHSARRFRFLPDSLVDSTYFVVHWLEVDFPPPVKRGLRYDVGLTLQEV